jgi:hypothetical protein
MVAATNNQRQVAQPCRDLRARQRSRPQLLFRLANDTEFDRTAKDCVSVDEWAAGADLYPDALGQTRSMSKSELELAVQSVCFENKGTPMCEDAAAQEILK